MLSEEINGFGIECKSDYFWHMQNQLKFLFFLILLITISVVFWNIKSKNTKETFYKNKQLNLDFSGKKKILDERLLFIDSIVRAAQFSNYTIIQKRNKFQKVKKYYQKKNNLRGVYKHWFEKLVEEYSVEILDLKDSLLMQQALNELDLKVQIVPVRLTLAQAILESAWGESRFAREGNAYFGIHCYSEGCGMNFGSGKSNVYVKTYPDLETSVFDYMHFLNAKPGPKNFRLARQTYFNSDKQDILQLAAGLDSYSEIGGNYQKIIRDLIRNYIPNEIEDY